MRYSFEAYRIPVGEEAEVLRKEHEADEARRVRRVELAKERAEEAHRRAVWLADRQRQGRADRARWRAYKKRVDEAIAADGHAGWLTQPVDRDGRHHVRWLIEPQRWSTVHLVHREQRSGITKGRPRTECGHVVGLELEFVAFDVEMCQVCASMIQLEQRGTVESSAQGARPRDIDAEDVHAGIVGTLKGAAMPSVLHESREWAPSELRIENFPTVADTLGLEHWLRRRGPNLHWLTRGEWQPARYAEHRYAWDVD